MQVSVKGEHPDRGRETPNTANAEENAGERLSPETALVPVWVGMLRTHNRVVSQIDAALQEKHHLSLSSFEVLLHLSFQPERRMRLAALAEAVVLTQSGMSRLIDRLEKARWVRREPYLGDGRGAYAALTEEGLALFREAEATHLAAVRAYFLDHLTETEMVTLAHVWRLLSQRTPDPSCEA